jgi:site-specific DNA-adenine methylase
VLNAFFYYYGGKRKTAHGYGPPQFPTIIEPFAGALGYSCEWYKGRQVIGFDLDPKVAAIWK